MRYAMLLLLSGCALFPKVPETVNVPVYVPCVGTMPEKPLLKFDTESRGIDYQVQALLLDITELKRYALDLETIIDGCR